MFNDLFYSNKAYFGPIISIDLLKNCVFDNKIICYIYMYLVAFVFVTLMQNNGMV